MQQNNVQKLVQQVQIITQKIIECRKESGQTQDDVAQWISVDRRKIIEFEKCEKLNIELLCILAEKFSIELKLNHEQF